jgi:acyl-[acyl-carrier-protein]-phospholipid O-acyltransferase/long-chain-fatty-acid--[acyl-carrier-protein] ligase
MKTLARAFFRCLFWPLVWLLYRIRRIGTHRVPAYGGVLLLSNHVSYIDSFIIYLTCPRPVRFVVLENYTKVKPIAWFLHLFGAIPIRPEKSREAITRTIEALEAGDVVCLFPEGGLTRLGVTLGFKKGFELIVRKAGCPVVPVYMDGLWNSIFSFERGSYFKKWPNSFPCPLQVAYGEAIAAEDVTLDRVTVAVKEVSMEAFEKRREFGESLEVAMIRALKRKRRQTVFAEYGRNGGREWSRAYTLGLATAMARRWMNHPAEPGDRIGILLPPGPMSSVINLGLFLAGKTPVNLPFTIDQRETESLAKLIAPLGIRTVITSRAFMPHLIDFWQGDEGVFIDLKAVISAPGSAMAFFERMRAYIEPTWLTCWRLDLKGRTLDREAVGLVPGPGIAPVFLNAAALFQNARRIVSANFVLPDDVIFTEDYLSSAEGLAMGCWVPVMGRGRMVCRSFSLREDFETLESALLEQGVTLLSGSGSFYKSIQNALAVRSVKFGILFGPANQWEIEDREQALDLPLARAWSFQGRVIALSRPDTATGNPILHQPQKGRDPKAVGRFLPGIAGKIVDGRLYVKFAKSESGGGEWISGPREAEINEDGFVFIRDIDLA